MKKVEDYMTSIPDFPKEGIIFRDVTSVLESAEGYNLAIDELNKLLEGVEYDFIAGTVEMSYDLEYGSATIEIHKDSIKPGDKVVLVDDLIATGGTIQAAAKLIEQLGGEVVKMVFLIELVDLKGRELLKGYDIESVIQYEGE